MTKQALTISSALEHLPWLDRVAEPLQAAGQALFGANAAMQKAKDWLNGTPLRHRIHPALIIVPLGAWTAAGLLDALDAIDGDGRWSESADLLVGVGVVSALPTAATGLADWVDLYDHQRRVGVAHALVNSAALVLYAGSLGLRLGGKRGAARALAGVGLGLVSLGGMLGGDLVYNLGANVTHLLYPKPPDEFTDACASADLPEGRVRVVEVGRVPVMLRRHEGQIQAVEAWCPHAGGPLAEGEFEGDEVTCPWHGSRFCLRDGKPTQGPASAPLRTFDVRETGGRIHVKPSDELRSWPPAPESPTHVRIAPTIEPDAIQAD
jgi:nitrite reductase/ring-hydroxylating ferredoxin subunit/uncharacterized membrane protein